MTGTPSPETVAALFREACLTELQALKPGNVHIHAAGHGMTVEDFRRSAEAAAPAISRPGATVGRRILDAVEASWAVAGCNTNLGIILLAAPLVHAVLEPPAETAPVSSLAERLHHVVKRLTVADADLAYRAIRLSRPGGLGRSDLHDVAAPPTVTLYEAMAAAAGRDRIAAQYATGFHDILDFGITRLEAALATRADPVEAAETVFLAFLTAFADSHIARKHGLAKAEEIRRQAITLHDSLTYPSSFENRRSALLGFDRTLKDQMINPGTSADLTVATLLAHALKSTLTRPD